MRRCRLPAPPPTPEGFVYSSGVAIVPGHGEIPFAELIPARLQQIMSRECMREKLTAEELCMVRQFRARLAARALGARTRDRGV